MVAITALTAPAVPYKNVNARVIRKEGSARTVSMSRPTNSDPGNGTNDNTMAMNVPSTKAPTVVRTAICAVVTRARWNIVDSNTAVQVLFPFPSTEFDSTRTSG